jgi:hypothetical protein
LIHSLRDVGYNHTTSALCEHVDNAIEAGANEIRIFFRQMGKRGAYSIDAAVYDNGRGMAPNVLKVATSFGGSMNFDNRKGIARFGMGMKTAALSMSPVLEIYSWQEPGAIYSMMLDVEAVGLDTKNLVALPEPELDVKLPDEVASLLSNVMDYPKDRNDQELFAEPGDDLVERLGSSGTVVYMPQCDRLSSAKSKTLVDHAIKEMSRVYRRAIASGLKLYVNNKRVEAFDPTYAMLQSRHVQFLEAGTETQSRLIINKPVEIPVFEGSDEKATIAVKVFRLPIEQWSSLTRKTQKNDLRIFDGLTVSILRNDRELFAGPMHKLTTRHSVTSWYRIQIDFPGVLDEAFGVASNKQGVRLKGYVEEAIKDAIGGEIATLNEELKRFQSAQAASRTSAKPSASEVKAGDADAFQANALKTTPEEEAQLDANLRSLAQTLRRDSESEEDAFERIKASKYVIAFKHDEYWPFYDVKHKFGRVILTINTAHPFFTSLYEPLTKLSVPPVPEDLDEGAPVTAAPDDGPIVALDLLLLSLARVQGRLGSTSDDAHRLLDNFRREWSDTYRVQLMV